LGRDIKECLEHTDYLLGLVVLNPVPGALDLYQFGMPEMREHAGRPGIGQKALAAGNQQRRTPDPGPQRDVVFQRQAVRRAGAQIGIELPAVFAVGIPFQRVGGKMHRLLTGQPRVAGEDSIGAIGHRWIAADFPLRGFVEIGDPFGDPRRSASLFAPENWSRRRAPPAAILFPERPRRRSG
jgi:hypothetical protein